ncbi:MAG: aromatic ring-hydroxylating dioxygenase subunit alpha [Pseudorhodobacter sp.]
MALGPISWDKETRSLPAEYYISQDWLAQEKHLFLKGWQLVGHVGQIPAPGDYFTAELFDQAFFVIRDSDGSLRGYYNVCPHRGHQLVEGTGNKGRITCPYHAWTFTRAGALMGQPRGPQTQAPARCDIALAPVAIEVLAGFIFLNASGTAPPLAEFAPGLAAQVAEACPGLEALVAETGPALGHSYDCAANWKVLIDNYLECHHCGTAHKSFDDMMDIANSRFALHPNFTFQTAPTAMKAENAAFALDLTHDVTIGHFWWLFPNTVFGQFPGVPGFYASRFDPVGPDATRRRTWSLTVAAPTDPDMAQRQKLRSDWSVNVVSQEDRRLCESVQRGMHQAGFTQGWYVTDPEAHGISEHAMRHFHQTYLTALEPACISE